MTRTSRARQASARMSLAARSWAAPIVDGHQSCTSSPQSVRTADRTYGSRDECVPGQARRQPVLTRYGVRKHHVRALIRTRAGGQRRVTLVAASPAPVAAATASMFTVGGRPALSGRPRTPGRRVAPRHHGVRGARRSAGRGSSGRGHRIVRCFASPASGLRRRSGRTASRPPGE